MFTTLREEFEHLYDKLESNLVSFERDYKDVNNFYRLVQIGTRIEDKELLVKECWGLVNNPEYKGTPDLGGALCVIGYNDKNLDIEKFKRSVETYCISCNQDNPHNQRWIISLNYICGLLTNEWKYYVRCTTRDFTQFNSLILTKQLLAYEKMARICLDNKKTNQAKNLLVRGLEKYKQGLQNNLNKTVGKNGTYIHFACTELALLSDIASQLVLFLNNIDLYHKDRKQFEAIFDIKRFGYQKRCYELEKENQGLREKLNGVKI